jgi:hypothetical protein
VEQRLRAFPAATVKNCAPKRGTAMVTSFSEPTLAELLNDSVTRAVMHSGEIKKFSRR